MEKTLSESISRLFCDARAVACLASAALVFVSGCATYVRIDAPVADTPGKRKPGDPKFCIVDCTLEMHSPFPMVVVPGEKNGVSSQKVENLQPALQSAGSEWFSTEADAVPICVKIRADVTDIGRMGVPFDLRTSLMLDPGEWSEGTSVAAKRTRISILFPSSLPDDGWRKTDEPAQAGDVMGDDIPYSTHPFATVFTLIPDLKHVDGSPGGVDPHFAKILANEVVKAWRGLTSAERSRLLRNPFAMRRKVEVFPESVESPQSSNTGVAVAVEHFDGTNDTRSIPSVAGYGYSKSTRCGHVEISKNGTDHLAALKWARETAISRIVGQGAMIRIVSEKTLPNGNTQIDFEVVQ